jgi:hypothetical protein
MSSFSTIHQQHVKGGLNVTKLFTALSLSTTICIIFRQSHVYVNIPKLNKLFMILILKHGESNTPPYSIVGTPVGTHYLFSRALN